MDDKTTIEQAADILIGEVLDETVPATALIAALPAPVVAPPAPAPPDTELEELQDDMEYVRTNMKDVIDQAKASLTAALDMAEQSGEARSFEVVAQMITAITDANKSLVTLHKLRKDTHKVDKDVKGTSEAPTIHQHIDKAVFIGRAQDLLRTLKESEKALKD